MSNLQIVEELCAICTLQNKVITEMTSALRQLGAEVMESERAEAKLRYDALIGDGEDPCSCGGEMESCI